jgi:hypothetical protein
MAEETRTEFPPICTKLLAQEVKLLIKIMRLYAEDKVKNEKSILMCNFSSIQTPHCSSPSTKARFRRNVLSWKNSP